MNNNWTWGNTLTAIAIAITISGTIFYFGSQLGSINTTLTHVDMRLSNLERDVLSIQEHLRIHPTSNESEKSYQKVVANND